ELGSLSNLQELHLSGNQLSGTIPVELGNLSNLETLSLAATQLSGAIPVELGNLSNLETLYLHRNRLSGAIPSELGSLSNLGTLYLQSNRLSGAIPSELGSLSNLRQLHLEGNSNLSGPLPESLTALNNLFSLALGNTQLCAPTDAAFQAWLQGIENKRGVTNCGDGSGGSGGTDTTAPTVTNVAITSRPASGDTYREGETIQITVTFSEVVNVTGVPAVSLAHYFNGTFTNDMRALYTTGSGSRELVFRYVVTATDVDLDGISLAHNPIVLTAGPGSGTVRDNAGNNADRSYLPSRWVTDIAGHKVDGRPRDRAAPKIYWVDAYRVGKIQRTGRSGMEDLVTDLNAPRSLALDPGADKMYWTEISVVNSGTLHRGKIRRANLDGSGVESLVTGLGNPHHLALDIGAGKIYWTDGNDHKIRRANLDGSGVEDLVTFTGNGSNNVNNQNGLALDVGAGKMYWTQKSSDYLWYANLDGSGVRYMTFTGMAPPISLALGGGYLYWTSTSGAQHKIQRVKLDPTHGPTGGAQDLTGVSNLSFGGYLALDTDAGKIYWSSSGRSGRRNLIQRANLDGTGVATVVTELDSPQGLAIDPGN
ncbi:MAG: hypothetical protein F4Y63_06190, partial [Chloroflexi bacterium]|nr:hypothetical protein [Chloroflexota bacterium]